MTHPAEPWLSLLSELPALSRPSPFPVEDVQLDLPACPGYERRAAGPKGDGVFATRVFEIGETVMVGSIGAIAKQNDSYAAQIGPDCFVYEGGLKSIVNHSCEPNCGVLLNAQGAFDLVAMRGIREGIEITVDYAMQNYVIEHFPEQCLCGSRNCREVVTGWKDLPDDVKVAYRGMVAPFLMSIDRELRLLTDKETASAAC